MRHRKVVRVGVRYDMPDGFDTGETYELESDGEVIRFVLYHDLGHIIDIKEMPHLGGCDKEVFQRYLDKQYGLFLKIEGV